MLNAIREGVAIISRRSGKANTRYMGNFENSQPTTNLTYFDANNLYGWALTQPLPTGVFEWIELEQIVDIINYPNKHEYETMVECDLDYPEKRQEITMTLAPEIVEITQVHKLVPHQDKRFNYTFP